MSYALGDWSDVTPENMRGYPEDKLFFIMTQNRGGVYDTWASNELMRRRIVELQLVTSDLHKATNNVVAGVSALAESSRKLEGLTANLVTATDGVHQGVNLLAASSITLETLTVKLNRLTWTLVWLTLLAIPVTIGIEVWHSLDRAPTAPFVLQLPLPALPQTAPLPASPPRQ